jgi:hypothetical protein
MRLSAEKRVKRCIYLVWSFFGHLVVQNWIGRAAFQRSGIEGSQERFFLLGEMHFFGLHVSLRGADYTIGDKHIVSDAAPPDALPLSHRPCEESINTSGKRSSKTARS